MKEYDRQEALRLAGKMATAAEMVLRSPLLSLTDRLLFLKEALDEYNKYMLRSIS